MCAIESESKLSYLNADTIHSGLLSVELKYSC